MNDEALSKEALLKDALTAYLAEHFTQLEVRGVTPFEKDGTGLSFEMTADGNDYCLNVHDEAVAGLDREALLALFSNTRVASVMRDLSGFPVTLTANGCMFG